MSYFTTKYLPSKTQNNLRPTTWPSVSRLASKGVSLVADEGINGTVSGDYENDAKVHGLRSQPSRYGRPLVQRLMRKKSKLSRRCFDRYKKEIVHLGLRGMKTSIMTSIPLKQQVLTCLQRFKEVLPRRGIPLSLILVTTTSTTFHFVELSLPDIHATSAKLPQWVH